MTTVGRLVISRLLIFTAGLERVYDPFLFPALGTKQSIKKGKTIFAIQLAVYIYQKYIQCRFIYLFVLYSEISDRFPENGGNRYGSAPDTPWVMFRWPNHSRRDTRAKAISSTWKTNFTILRKTDKIMVRTIGRVRHIFSVQLYTGRLWLFNLFLKPQYNQSSDNVWRLNR